MPTSEKPKNNSAWFYWDEDGRRADADLHNPILEAGDLKAAQKVSRAVAKEAGLTDADIDSLFGTKD